MIVYTFSDSLFACNLIFTLFDNLELHLSGKSFQISREHVKTENHGSSSSKRSSSNKSNKSSDSPGKKAAITYLKKMPGARRGAFLDLVNACHNKTSPENKRKNTDSSPSDKGNNSARKKSNHASIGGYPVAAGISH